MKDSSNKDKMNKILLSIKKSAKTTINATNKFFKHIITLASNGLKTTFYKLRILITKKDNNAPKNTTVDDNDHTIVFSATSSQAKVSKSNTSVFESTTETQKLSREIIAMFLKITMLFVLSICIAGVGITMGMVNAYVGMEPSLDIDAITVQAQGSKIYDCNGDLITTYSGTEDRIFTKIEDIPQTLIDAFISTEDVRFYEHDGLDTKRLFSAILGNLTNTSSAGGSTITQQLIKNRVLTPERTLKRKIQEASLALKLETIMTKDEVLEAYLNSINLGGGNYGVAAAAWDYFNKPLDQLSIRECATIAGLAQAPNSYNPRKNYYYRDTPERTDARTETVLKRMYNGNFITLDEYNTALNTPLVVSKESRTSGIYDMPHFVEYAIDSVITMFLETRGLADTKKNRADIENEIRTSGYSIYTTVDPEIQHTVEDSLSEWTNYPKLANPNDSTDTLTNSDGTTYEVKQPQAAAVVIDQHTGELKAIVGSRDVPTALKTNNRAVNSDLPVGSSIKPLAVYGPALDLGLTPSTLIDNTSDPIEGWNSDKGRPDNYGGGSFTGPTTMRSGLIHSYNIVAARLLLEHVGLDTSYNYLVSLGVNESHINKTGAGLALGTSGLTPLEMAGGFATIANDGEYIEPIAFTTVTDLNGKVILDATSQQDTRQVYKRSTSYQLISMLTDAVNSGTGTRAKISGQQVAGKTGTNESYRGVFFAGITGYYTATVWIGHDQYTPKFRYGASGGTYAAPLWKDFMSKILKGLPNKPILSGSAESYNLVKATVCAKTGLLASEFCEDTYTEYFDASNVPTKTCTEHDGKEKTQAVNDYIDELYSLMDTYNASDSIRSQVISKTDAFVAAWGEAGNYKDKQTLYDKYVGEMEQLKLQMKNAFNESTSSPTITPTQPATNPTPTASNTAPTPTSTPPASATP